LDAGNLVETFLEEQATGAVFVFTGSVARVAGDQHDFFVSGTNVEHTGDRESERYEGVFHFVRDLASDTNTTHT
jgi:hypothetical protein